MDGDHELLGAWAELMDDFGDELLASAALALQQNSRASRRHLLDYVQHFLHRRRLANNILHAESVVELAAERYVLNFEFLLAQRAGNAHLQLIDLQPAFGNVI